MKNIIRNKEARSCEDSQRKKNPYIEFFFSFYELTFTNQSKFVIFVFKIHLFKTILECGQNTGEANTSSKQRTTPGIFWIIIPLFSQNNLLSPLSTKQSSRTKQSLVPWKQFKFVFSQYFMLITEPLWIENIISALLHINTNNVHYTFCLWKLRSIDSLKKI